MIVNPEIIFEDDNILVIDKPRGVEIYRNDDKDQNTIVNWLVKKYPRIVKIGPDPARPGIVHRLDKAVSGILIIAKSEEYYEHLVSQFKSRKVKKEYQALVHGKVLSDEGEILFPIARAKSGRFAALPLNSEKGRTAITGYEVLERYINFTLLKVKIKTGRTHQIRVHLFAIGHSVVGDNLYKQKKIKKSVLDCLFLCSTLLIFHDPGGEWREFKVGLPEDLVDFLGSLKKDQIN